MEKNFLAYGESEKTNQHTDMFTIVKWNLNSGNCYSSYSFKNYAMSRVDQKVLLEQFEKKCGVHPDDVKILHDSYLKATKNETGEKMIVRLKMTDGSYSWTCVSVKFLFSENKAPMSFMLVLVGVNGKVNQEPVAPQTFVSLKVLINHKPVGIAVYEVDKDSIDFHLDEAVTQKPADTIAAEITAFAAEAPIVSQAQAKNVASLQPEELYELYRSGQTIEAQIQLPGTDESWGWLYFLGNVLDSQGGCPLCYISLADIPEPLENIKLHKCWHERLRSQKKSQKVITYYYIPATDTLIYRIFLEGVVRNIRMENYLRNFPQKTRIHADSVDAYQKIILNSKTSCNKNTFEFLADLYGRGYQWWRTRQISVADKSGHMCYLVGRADLIGPEREKEKMHYTGVDMEAAFQRFFLTGALIAVKYDITTGERFVTQSDVFPPKVSANTRLSKLLELLSELVHPEDQQTVMKHLDLVNVKHNLDTTDTKISYDCRARSLSGKFDGYHWVGVNYMNVAATRRTSHPIVFIYVIDINEKKKSQLRLVDQAKRDTLTGLLNRTGFIDYFAEFTLRASMDGDRNVKTAAFVMINIDNMKQINDSFGHVFGDRLIENTAVTLKAIHKDSAARLYADKFALYLADISEQSVFQEQMRILGNALMQKVNDDITLTASIGIAIYPTDAEEIGSLYDKADMALGKARKDGGNRCIFYSPELDKLAAAERDTSTAGAGLIKKAQRVYIRTFGYFELFVDGQALPIKLEKAKELLALLVDRRGGFLSTNEAISFLWEDEPADNVTKSRYRKVAMRLKNILSKYHIEDIVENKHGLRRIVPEKISCDYYEYLAGNPEVQNLFNGVYMSNYSWGEMTLSTLEQMNFKPE
jgi:diguanylate cyclase (GGDEF)-like protein